jgi:hypothetical protein
MECKRVNWIDRLRMGFQWRAFVNKMMKFLTS